MIWQPEFTDKTLSRKPGAVQELDDASHLRPERRRRDILLEEVLRQAGIPLLRSHDARKLLQMTGEWLNTTGADQQSPEHRS